MSTLRPIVVCRPILERSTFRKLYWNGQEAERGDRKAGKEAAKDAWQEMAGAQVGIVMVETGLSSRCTVNRM